MFHKTIIGISKFFFTLFALTLVGYFVALFVMSLLNGYIDTNGIETFYEQFELMLQNLEEFITK